MMNSVEAVGHKIYCKDCGHIEKVELAVLRSIAKIKLLFPSRPITTPAIKEWCNIIPDNKRISRILEKHYHFTEIKKGRTYS